jgi:hypothetical protein
LSGKAKTAKAIQYSGYVKIDSRNCFYNNYDWIFFLQNLDNTIQYSSITLQKSSIFVNPYRRLLKLSMENGLFEIFCLLFFNIKVNYQKKFI